MVFFVGASAAALIATLVYYVIRGFGITAGFHRLLAHRSFRTSRAVQFALALFGSLAIQGGPLWWVAHHRSHHRYTETDRDIHSPRTKGFWQAHIGWMFSPESFNENGAGARDLHQFGELKWLQRRYPWIALGQGVVIYLIGAAIGALFPESRHERPAVCCLGVFLRHRCVVARNVHGELGLPRLGRPTV